MTVPIHANTILLWIETDSIERVLWIEPDNSQIVVIDINDPNALPVIQDMADVQNLLAVGKLVKRPEDPYAYLHITNFDALLSPSEEPGHNAYPDQLTLKQHDVLSKRIHERNQAWETIRELAEDEPAIYFRKGRGGLVENASRRFNVHKTTIYNRLRRFWQRGKTENALLPDFDKRGGKGTPNRPVNGVKLGRPSKLSKEHPEFAGINVTEDIERIFRVSLKRWYNNRSKPPLSKVHEKMLEKFFSIGTRIDQDGNTVPILPHASTLPTLAQLIYFQQKERNIENELRSRDGERRFNLRHRANLGESTHMAFGPGSIFQIDATIGDLYLTSELNAGDIIGRPVIYTVKDVLTRMVAGLYVGLEGPSWVGAMMALENATTNKVAFCAKYGIEIDEGEWPTAYLPQAILADRGELLSGKADQAVKNLRIRIHNTPPYRADWKGIIEQHFRLCNLRAIHWLPGAVKERLRERGERNYILDAAYTLQEFTALMIDLALYHNSHWMEWYSLDEYQIMDKVNPIPIDLWRWGIANRSGCLREADPNIIKLNLLPRAKGSVTREGILVNSMHYTGERAMAQHWFVKAHHSGSWHVPVAYDPRNPDLIYLCLDDGKIIEPCQRLPKDIRRFGQAWLEEIQEWEVVHDINSALAKTDSQQATAVLNARIDQRTEKALKRKAEYIATNPVSDTQAIKNVRQNRTREKEHIRQQEAWDLRNVNQPEADVAVPADLASKPPTETATHSPAPTDQTGHSSTTPFNRKAKLLSKLEGKQDEEN